MKFIGCSFTFVGAVRLQNQDIQTRQLRKLMSLSREAAHQLLVKASDIAKSDNKRSQGEKAAKKDPDFVCVHIRRSV